MRALWVHGVYFKKHKTIYMHMRRLLEASWPSCTRSLCLWVVARAWLGSWLQEWVCRKLLFLKWKNSKLLGSLLGRGSGPLVSKGQLCARLLPSSELPHCRLAFLAWTDSVFPHCVTQSAVCLYDTRCPTRTLLILCTPFNSFPQISYITQ